MFAIHVHLNCIVCFARYMNLNLSRQKKTDIVTLKKLLPFLKSEQKKEEHNCYTNRLMFHVANNN